MTNLSRINIDTSDISFKKIIFNSKYKINKILSDPFGSTKMRFHYPSSFNFYSKEIKNNNDYTYEIIINRKEKNRDYSNSQYFVGEGWSNNLTITCIPEEFEINESFITNFIPKNYGTVEVSNINNINKFKFGIVIPTYGRLEYLEECFNSLKKCNLMDCIIIIIDESLTKKVNDDKIQSNNFIKNFDFEIPTIKIYKNTHGNMFDSINIGLDILGNFCDYLTTLDSDTIHSYNFMNNILETYHKVLSVNNKNLTVITGFNTEKHKILSDDNLFYHLKETVGGCHLFFSTDDYWNFIRHTLISYKWDTNIYNLVNKLNGTIASTKPSCIEHIGEKSSVRSDENPYDQSLDFNVLDIKNKKFYIISEDLEFENNQTWIIDVFKKEFIEYSNLLFVDEPEDADIIWIVGMNLNKIKTLKNIDLSNKSIVTTIHHIDWTKIDDFNKTFNEIKDITSKFHVICEKVYYDLKKLTNKPILISNFWINENIFYNIPNKNILREKYNIPKNSYCIGSFQRDTEGKQKCIKPKLSKGPDILIKIIDDLILKKENLLVILSGRRRNYIINKLKNRDINYLYFPMVSSDELNELYNCLDMYIVSSRVEGGPRAIIECGIAKIPLISTDVGISNMILDEKSIYDMNNFITYKEALPDTEVAYNNSNSYSIKNYMNKFINNVFN
jgi:hypothetical protein